MVKIAQKVPSGFHGDEGARAFIMFRSYLSTVGKQWANRHETLRQPFNDGPRMPAALGIGLQEPETGLVRATHPPTGGLSEAEHLKGYLGKT